VLFRSVAPGDAVTVRVRLRRSVACLPLHVAVSFEDENGLALAVFATHWDGHPPLSGEDEEEVTLKMPACPFARGQLDVTAYVTDATGLQLMDLLLAPRVVTITPRRWEPGLVRVAHSWEAVSWQG